MVAPPAHGATTQAREGCARSPSAARMHAIPNMAPPAFPYSARRAQPLDLKTVERRGHPSARDPPSRTRPHGLLEAPTFRPTEAEFRDPMEYIRSISEKASKFGICKIIPPDNWHIDFAIDSERFHFRTRKQEINLVEGGNRTNLNYLDNLAKFHKQYGAHLNRFPSVDKRPLDLYKLKKAVEIRGGFEKVCKDKKWAEIGRDLGYSGKIMSSLSTSLKNSYQRWLHPYEEWLKLAKPGMPQNMEFEYNGNYSPAPASQQASPALHFPLRAVPPNGSPTTKASTALQNTIDSSHSPSQPPPPVMAPRQPSSTSGFTAVNNGGFAAVNAPSGFMAVNQASPPILKMEPNTANPSSQPRGFAAINGHHSPPMHTNGVLIPNGVTNSNPLKRTMSHDSLNGESGSDAQQDGEKGNSRRSKRPKKSLDGTSNAGLRALTPQPKSRSSSRRHGEVCDKCGKSDDETNIIVCDGCDLGYHRDCHDPPLTTLPEFEWHCHRCLVGNHEYGFEEGNVYSLKTFQEKANSFKENYFANRTSFDPVTNKPRPVSEEDVEREFWRLVEDITETVEVEYGADIHSTTHGSGFPTIEKDPLNAYSRDPWNLNVMPFLEDSLFRHIKGDISGMTVPWLYVGMCFSTFCWHNEDHYAYSANYQHFGATKTWYGIPGKDALAFEAAMREAVPELFESQPDLLFQLVTILPPNQLRKAGVDVYALDQRAGQFVITFPQAYHAGFNHGFNFNEAVNFAPADWEPFGDAGVQRLQEFRKQPCFSHAELLFTAAASDSTIKTARWLGPALERTRDRELAHREQFATKHKAIRTHASCNYDTLSEHPHETCGLVIEVQDEVLDEEEYQCHHCKAFSFLSQFRCKTSQKVSCLLHADVVDCCDEPRELRTSSSNHYVVLRYNNQELNEIVQKVIDKAHAPQAWEARLDTLLDGESRPQLRQLHALLADGQKIPAPLSGFEDLADFVRKCDQLVEEATLYLTRKQQNRRRNEKAWRRLSVRGGRPEDKETEPQLTLERMKALLDDAEQLGFSAPQFDSLQEKLVTIDDWRGTVKEVFESRTTKSAEELEILLDEGRGFMMGMPELSNLEKMVQRAQWSDAVDKARADMSNQSLDDCKSLLKRATEDLGIHAPHPQVAFLTEMVQRGDFWEVKAKEVMAADDVHYPQLESLHNQVQAQSFPVNKETLAQMDGILAKNREAKRQIITLVEQSHDADFRKRPTYIHVRDVLKGLEDLNGKPHGTADLERELRRHEDWMRRGKKLFGKANAPLHILEQHMKFVEERNNFVFDLDDIYKPPVEPASREPTPILVSSLHEVPGEGDKVLFCLCRQPEAGLMIECEICHDWYHAKCLKLARGKVKEYDLFTCPICDWRVKIPRDAARPKLEDLQSWYEELPDLPFQPEEEELLKKIVEKAQAFREYLVRWTMRDEICMSRDELPELIHYLRKIEGAEVLLAQETNAFRQELHKWQPIADEPPPILDQSLSTRKPRPTKQQKLMRDYGVSRPEDLPPQLRTKGHTRKKTTEQFPAGTLMPKAGEPGLQPRQAPEAGDSDTPAEIARQSSTGNAPTKAFISGAEVSGGFTGYPARSPSPMFSPGHSQPPDDATDASIPRPLRDAALPAFRRDIAHRIDDDLRAALVGGNGVADSDQNNSDVVSPAPGEYDSMFMEMTNVDDTDSPAAAALEQVASQAREALEMFGAAGDHAAAENGAANDEDHPIQDEDQKEEPGTGTETPEMFGE